MNNRGLVARRGAAVMVAAFGVIALSGGGCDTLFPSSSSKKLDRLPVRVNSVGYVPDRVKRAAVVDDGGLTDATTFSVKRTTDDGEAFSGTLGPAKPSSDTGERLRLADFTALTSPGEYYLEVQGLEKRSATFVIAADAYRTVFQALMMGIYGQRCGTSVTFNWNGDTFVHGPCHMEDGYLDYYGQGDTSKKDGLYGWHDAGDYGKYTVNGSFSLGMMLKAWEQFPGGIQSVALDAIPAEGALPKYLAELKFQLDWLFAMQFEDGAVSHKLTSLDFNGFEMPEADRLKRYYVSPSSAAAADLVAVMANASRVFRSYDAVYADKCLAAAQKSYAYLQANPAAIAPQQENFKTGGYTTGDADDRLWAKAEMWAAAEAAGLPAAAELLAALEADPLLTRPVARNWDWSNVDAMGILTYALSTSTARTQATVDTVVANIKATADQIKVLANADAYGRGQHEYYWGSNGVVVRMGMVLFAAARLLQDPSYADAAVQQLDHVLGRNYYSRSYLTGVGFQPPQNPHHRPSSADANANAWPGFLVGGSWQTEETSPNGPATFWVDIATDYRTNEVAINWTAAMIFTAAGFLAAP